jgi:uncharacterized membrane protein
MLFETTIEIEAPREKVWSTLVDVERWPEWTASMTSIELLTGAPLAPSSRLRVKQPRMRALVWEVTDLVPGEAFTWRSSILGVTSVGTHRIAAASDHAVTVTLALDQSGFLAPIVGFITSRMTRHYVDMEARGLKARCEAGVSRATD